VLSYATSAHLRALSTAEVQSSENRIPCTREWTGATFPVVTLRPILGSDKHRPPPPSPARAARPTAGPLGRWE
jgi:hypothetical protein